ncbi:fumarylacetoacetate hydrolase family protein [Bacillus cytotoxicus]|uniref:fumarylacetoacetate hydrolase family protein n=1 Tax=Bacillus cereus group TaxID=86661 RepID=UPI001AEDFC59|nr:MULTISPECIES: fumarylacetoacetate hydrolase family protein [Bacillus cereus group]QTR72069.1 fumarylacetoacetate hydrolase family protein [Bacillus cytotoxicus]QTR77204.1 fumarylacetoacetate hydrolase family protein [Bacillus cytotoxicus]HDR4570993.1 fumarylacetoacetate hydrolase family protein [Bacillus cytotoxicus]HDR4586805.1 fumarylacetoacetate hydrolase family protein [Bacillus cytotoxicus]HDR7313961.1 fumarylacetoacetate hydrolase family protein [Bacillus cytotoxicus]
MRKIQFKCYGRSQIEEAELHITEDMVIWNGKEYKSHELALDIPTSGNIYGTLLNYKGALAALGNSVHELPYKQAPMAPILYIKPINTMIARGMPIPLPSEERELEVGAALGIVIGKRATKVREEEALTYIQGYTIVNDISIPHESVYRPAIKQKARDGFCPVGPWVIEKGAIPNPNDVSIQVYVNGILRQENHTKNLIRPVERLIADVTEFMTLYEGDILLVGVPENPPLVKNGDRIRIEIEGIGSLENQVVLEKELVRGGVR